MEFRPNLRCNARSFAAALLLAAASDLAAAADPAPDKEPSRLVLTGGYGQKVAVYGLGALWQIPVAVDTLARYELDTRLGADILRWDGPASGNAGEFLWDAGVTPYLRWRPTEGTWHRSFAEVGVGVHLLSHTAINPSREFAIAFQFGERLAVGFDFGDRNRYEVALFVQHVSNAKIAEPNAGLTYFGATLGIPFD
jgi:lipid A 3-O-deacylase